MSDEFDTAAASWDTPERLVRSRHIADAIMQNTPVHPSWVALDLGCGTGQLSWMVGPHVARVLLVDTAAGMLDEARTQAASHPGTYEVRQLDLASEPLGEQVDLVVSAMALHHIPDTAALIASLARTLRPGGWIALADIDADPDNHFHPDDYEGHRGIDRDALAGLARSAGFTRVETRTALTVRKTKHDVEHEFPIFMLTAQMPTH